MDRHAACHCGALVVRCAGEPRKISLCHCQDCQRRTGSLFSVAAFYDRAAVIVESGTAKVFRRGSASGFEVSFHFCPDCGTSLWWEPDRMPGLIGLAVGAFADPAFPKPEQAVWGQHRHCWLHLPGDVPEFEQNPARAPDRG